MTTPTNRPSRPNIVVFFTDQQRYDSLGCNGNPVARTPNLDTIAADGVRLENHIVANTVCMPSRASLFTGRFPNAHRLWRNGVALPTGENTLPQLLKGRGYDTAAMGKLHLTPTAAYGGPGLMESERQWRSGSLDDWHGPYYGFDHVELTIGHGEGALRVGHYANDVRRRFPDVEQKLGLARPDRDFLPDSYPSAIPVEAHHSTWVADRTIAYLHESARRDRPFFVFCSFPDPHHPFTPPEPYASMFDPEVVPGPSFGECERATKPEHYDLSAVPRSSRFVEDGGTVSVDLAKHEGVLREAIAHTYGMVSLIDHNVGRVMSALAELGLDGDTVVVFTADHGELLGDHGLVRKGPYPCRSLLRVPCVIRAPGLTRPGGVVSRPTSNTDILPTLVSLADGEVPATVQGRSLVGLLGGADAEAAGHALSMGWSKGDARYNYQTLFTERWRVSWFPRLEDGELYDLRADPNELDNLFDDPDRREIRDALLLELYRRYSATEEPEPTAVANW